MATGSTDDSPVVFAAAAPQFQGVVDNFATSDKEQAKALRKGLKVMCRECQMGVAAAQWALADAGVVPGKFEPERVGITFGSDYMVSLPDEFTSGYAECIDESGHFQFSKWATDGLPKMSPLWLLKYLPNMPACHLAMYNDFRGPNNSLTLREASANVALVEACQTILRGRADVMVVGATGTRIHPLKIVHVLQQEEVALADGDPAQASRPFDRNRTGMVIGEGAGAVIVEDFDRAVARGATIYAEIVGGASSSVAGRHLVAQRGQAMKNVLTGTLSRTETGPGELGFLHAHGLSTRSGDAEEAWAINQVFGDRGRPLPIVAAKGHCGNLGAGSGMIEIIAGVMALNHQRLFSVLNYKTPDPQCRLRVVAGADEDAIPGRSFVNLSVTPQGQASAVLVRKLAEAA
jgi:3-oxoacyl-[acyl-carrier-protein] synthase II